MPSIPIAEFVKEVVAVYEGKGRAAVTIRQIRQVLRELEEVGVNQTSQVTDSAISRWIQAFPERTPVTLKSHLRSLSSLCTRMVKKNYIDLDPFEVDPVSEWVRPDGRPAPPRRRWSKSPEQIKAVFARADSEAAGGSWEASRLRAFIYTLFLTGGRPGEILRLERADFEPRLRTLAIHPKWITQRAGRRVWWKPKTIGSSAVLPIGPGLAAILAEWSRQCESPWLFPGVKRYGPWVTGASDVSPLGHVAALGLRAGVPGLTCKSARKGIGTHKAIGLTPMERREYFRHSDDATGDFYDDERVESLRPAAEKIERFYLDAA
jgi:integrase